MSRRPLYAVAARALLRDTVLDALAELLDQRDWAGVTMAEVARSAGVSRQTLYNEFGDRRGLAEAYLLREADRLVAVAERSIAAHPRQPRKALEAAFTEFMRTAQGHPIARAIATGGGDDLLALVTARGAPVLAAATDRLAAALGDGWPAMTPGDARLAAETLVRLAISHAALPSSPPARTAAGVARALAPFLEAAVSDYPGSSSRRTTQGVAWQ